MQNTKNLIDKSYEIDLFDEKRFIYYLISSETIVYVGKTTNLHARLAAHISDDGKKFSSVKVVEIHPSEDIDRIEIQEIIKYQPKYNKASLPSKYGFAALDRIKFLSEEKPSLVQLKKAVNKFPARSVVFYGKIYYEIKKVINSYEKLTGISLSLDGFSS